jgi:DNA polymerase III epsilon subunit-like protein
MEIRRLLFDIETSPCVGWFWRPSYNTQITYNQIIDHAKIICISYKWDNQDKVYSLNWDSKQNDKKMLSDFIKVANQADEIIGHNSDKFDIKWIRTRCMYHSLDMFPNYKSFDTLKFFRGSTLQPSNRLNDIGDYFNLGHKVENEKDLWQKVCFKNDRKALKRMVNYCNGDVLLLEKVYNKLKNYSKPTIHKTGVKTDCPECGSDNISFWGFHYSPSGTKKQRCKCKVCHKCFSYTPKKNAVI